MRQEDTEAVAGGSSQVALLALLQEVWKEIDVAIGPDKIFAGFAVSLSDQQESVTLQWQDCLTRLVTRL